MERKQKKFFLLVVQKTVRKKNFLEKKKYELKATLNPVTIKYLSGG